jgi:hypothetical protein
MMMRGAVLVCVVSIALVACGGGGSGGGNGGAPPPAGWVSGVFSPASDFVARCAVPRTGIDPSTNRPYPDVAGSMLTEKNWLRSWSNDLYLWYSEIVDRDPAPYTVPDYFNLLKTTALTASGHAKDRFHFTYLTSDWEKLSQSGVSAGYGAEWAIISASPPRKVLVAYTEPGSPATDPLGANLARGAEVTMVDNVDVVNGTDVNALNAAFYPAAANEAHTFTVLDLGAAATRTFTMTSANVASTPVQNVQKIATGTGNVGYMLFNDHLATAEAALINAVNTLASAGGVTDLVLDIRYNGGGYLVIASELAYMIAGTQSVGKTFELTHFNSKHPTFDPVSGQRITPDPFQTTAVGLSAPSGQVLPTLGLSRVFVLTGPTTCSASESIINSLEGINVEVIQIGSTTCGKPYGFYPQDNCGTTYFTVEFQGENAKGFGDYPDGFSPANTPNIPGVANTGCSVKDDYTKQLGDPLEARLAAALDYRQSGGTLCPVASGLAPPRPGVAALSVAEPSDGIVIKPQWLQNKIKRR